MTTPTYTSPFTGTVVTATEVSYASLTFSTSQQLYWPTTVNGTEPVAARIIDCYATSSNLNITLPNASQGALGTDILIRNLGAYAFTVTDANGTQSVLIPINIAKYFYLINNTTIGGTWGNVTFGAGTSVADAATLAGLGLTTYEGKLATTQNVIDLTTIPTLGDQSRAATYNWNSGNATITLPNIQTLSPGWFIGFRNNGTGTLNFTPVSPQLINKTTTIATNPGDSGFIMFDSNSGGFITLGWIAPNALTFSAATYDVDSIITNNFDLTGYAPIIQTYIAQSGSRTAGLLITLPAITQIYVLVNNTNQVGYNVSFKCSGSSATPFQVSTGQIATVLTDGVNIFSLTTASTGNYYASNGVSGAPSFSFSSNPSTGLYLRNTNVLGIAANGVEMIDINNSNPTSPAITMYASLTATLTVVSGGTF
jgi:hypothetical protein